MSNKKVNSIILAIFIVVCSYFSSCYANSDIENTPNQETVDEYSKKSFLDISKAIDYMKQNITYTNGRVSEMKRTEEYKKYPAVRLNVETPLFGINSMINQRLQIKSNVSTTDIISGYSIYDIIRTNKIKVPSLSVGSVIVSTREIELKEDMTVSDANSTLKTLLLSMNQTKDARKFMDDYVNKSFNEYISKERKDKIANLNKKSDELISTLLEQEDKIIYLYMIKNNDYNTYVKEYNDIYNKIYSIKVSIQNILVAEELLDSYTTKIGELSISVKNLQSNLNTKILEENANKELIRVINNAQKLSIGAINNVKSYIDNSYENLSIEKIKELNNLQDSNLTIEDNEQDRNTKKVVMYPVTLEDSVNLNNLELLKVEKIYEDFMRKKYDTSNTTSTITYEFNTKEYNDIVKQLLDVYKQIIKNNKNFFKGNLESLNKDASNKTLAIANTTDSYISSDYMYFNFYLTNDMEELNKKYTNENSYISNLELTNQINLKINEAKTRYDELIKLYNSLTKSGQIS